MILPSSQLRRNGTSATHGGSGGGSGDSGGSDREEVNVGSRHACRQYKQSLNYYIWRMRTIRNVYKSKTLYLNR